jgi:hypothetical protein
MRKKTTVRLSEEAERLQAALAVKLGLNFTKVLEQALRKFAEGEGLLYDASCLQLERAIRGALEMLEIVAKCASHQCLDCREHAALHASELRKALSLIGQAPQGKLAGVHLIMDTSQIQSDLKRAARAVREFESRGDVAAPHEGEDHAEKV